MLLMVYFELCPFDLLSNLFVMVCSNSWPNPKTFRSVISKFPRVPENDPLGIKLQVSQQNLYCFEFLLAQLKRF